MTYFRRTVLYVCCMVIALMGFVAALTITVALAMDKLPDPHAWVAVLFFILVGGLAWIAGSALERDPLACGSMMSEAKRK